MCIDTSFFLLLLKENSEKNITKGVYLTIQNAHTNDIEEGSDLIIMADYSYKLNYNMLTYSLGNNQVILCI